MRHHKRQDKTSRRTPPRHQLYASMGRNGNSAAPPQYGIDFVDRRLAEQSRPDGLTQLNEKSRRIQDQHSALLEDNVSAVDNHTGMPDQLKTGLEQLSGLDLSSVRVHYNSDKPERLQALAYTQGQDIHVGPGQEKHLAHEGWHAVQQMYGRVKPTMQARGLSVNDDMALEHEADEMGTKALQSPWADATRDHLSVDLRPLPASPNSTVQRLIRGFEAIKNPGQIPDDWVQLYIKDLRHHLTHLYDADLVSYLDENDTEWKNANVIFNNTNGNHWDVHRYGLKQPQAAYSHR